MRLGWQRAPSPIRTMVIAMSDARHITGLLRGKWFGNYGQAFCPAHPNTRTPALSLTDGANGRLLIHCHAGCSFTDVMVALRALGLCHARSGYGIPDQAATTRRTAEESGNAERRARHAQRLWDECVNIAGTVAEEYLKLRGIDCPLPETLRFHPACRHPSAQRFPALVALVEGCGGCAVHRTYLAPSGSSKADIEPAKAMLGGTRGGAVHLSESQGPLVVAEGIETGLSLLCGLLRTPGAVYAALSTSGIRGLNLPPKPGRLTIASDGDTPGRDAAHALASRAHALGWTVSLLPAPEGRDWNDVLRGTAVTT